LAPERNPLGEPRFITGPYLQDWVLLDTDWNWRREDDKGGELCAVGDIRSHWIDLTSFIPGQRVIAVMAELATFVKTRQQPAGSVETFATEHAGPSHRVWPMIDQAGASSREFGPHILHMQAKDVMIGRDGLDERGTFSSGMGLADPAHAGSGLPGLVDRVLGAVPCRPRRPAHHRARRPNVRWQRRAGEARLSARPRSVAALRQVIARRLGQR
jgi:hypothetical protein